MTGLPPPRFELLADLRLDLAPVISGGKTPFGTTNWFEITGGSLKSIETATGPKLDATILSGGGDYSTLHASAGAITLDVSALARTNDAEKALFKFHNTGVIRLTEKNGRIFSGETGPEVTGTEFGEEFCMERITCNTGSEIWGWLNFEILIGQGRLLVKDGVPGLAGIEFRVFRVLAS